MNARSAEPDPRKKVLVVDDHPLVLKGLVDLINRQEDFVCAGEADRPATLFASLEQSIPDLVLLDLWLGDADGLELIKSLHARYPDLPILVLSQSDENLFAERTLRAGARGYLSKLSPSQDVIEGLRAVGKGEIFLSYQLTMALLRKAIQTETDARPSVTKMLTERELDVYRLLGHGMSSRAIAAELNVSLKTIEAHRENIKHKLGYPNAVTLVQAATNWVRNNKQESVQFSSPGGRSHATE